MRTVRAETLKLRRSTAWVVVLLLPVAVAFMACLNTLTSGEPLEDGWHTLWVRVAGFHALFPLALGVALLASLMWRPEHKGGNWNALMGGPTTSGSIVWAKTVTLWLLTLTMQAVLLVLIVAVGRLAFGLDGFLPGQYLVATVVSGIGVLPLVALQSALSLFVRSFAGPVAIALVGAGASVVAQQMAGDLALLSPYSVATRTLHLSSGVFGDAGALTPEIVALLVGASLAWLLVINTVGARVLDGRDVRV